MAIFRLLVDDRSGMRFGVLVPKVWSNRSGVINYFSWRHCVRGIWVMNEVQIYELQVYWNVMRHHANSFEDTSMQFVSFLRWHTRTAFANLRWPTYMYVLLGRLDSGCCHNSPNIHTLKSCASVMDKGHTVCHTKWLIGVFIKKCICA